MLLLDGTLIQQLFLHQQQYFLQYAIMLGLSAKDRHSNETNKIVIKPGKIFPFTEVLVHQRDTVKSS